MVLTVIVVSYNVGGLLGAAASAITIGSAWLMLRVAPPRFGGELDL